MSDPSRSAISFAEVLAVTNGTDEATGQPVVCLTLRPFNGFGWGHINYALSIENARSLLDRLTTAFETSPSLFNGRSGTTAWASPAQCDHRPVRRTRPSSFLRSEDGVTRSLGPTAFTPSVSDVIPLHHDPHYTFRFADDRIIPRFHLEGVEPGRRVDVFRIDPATGERLDLLTTGTTCDGGWVDVTEPIIVRPGDAFVAVPGEVDA